MAAWPGTARRRFPTNRLTLNIIFDSYSGFKDILLNTILSAVHPKPRRGAFKKTVAA
jgi:hypothetical protein